jgi:hypothetical protein
MCLVGRILLTVREVNTKWDPQLLFARIIDCGATALVYKHGLLLLHTGILTHVKIRTELSLLDRRAPTEVETDHLIP